MMQQHPVTKQSPIFIILTINTIVLLTVLINVAFKIIEFHGLILAVNSLLCPLFSALYLTALRRCTWQEQRHLLHIALIALYGFCVGIYLLVNLPAAEYMHDNPVYQIVFDDIPRKFFAITTGFALSFYLPHFLFCSQQNIHISNPRYCLLLALLGGAVFYVITFLFLFSGTRIPKLEQIFFDSSLITGLLLLGGSALYLTALLHPKCSLPKARTNCSISFPYYLICIALVITLICLACEYRIIAFGQERILAASSLFFPLTLVISTVIGELCGYRTNLQLSLLLSATQVLFDLLLTAVVALPSPDFYDLNPFYSFIMVRRLPADSLTLFVTFMSNALLLHHLQRMKVNRSLRIIIANMCANSLLCLIDYSLLFGGIYPYEQIIRLVLSVWEYKTLVALISLPIILKICNLLERKNSLTLQYS